MPLLHKDNSKNPSSLVKLTVRCLPMDGSLVLLGLLLVTLYATQVRNYYGVDLNSLFIHHFLWHTYRLFTLDSLILLHFSGHDSSITIATFSSGGQSVQQCIRFRDLPLTCLTFVSERAIIGAGHDLNPMIFTSSGGGGTDWSYMDRLEKKKEKAKESATGGVAAAR